MYYNQFEKEGTFFGMKIKKVISLNEMYPNLIPILKVEELDDMPGDIFVYDMELKQFPNIVLLMKNAKDEVVVKIISTTPESEDSSFFTRGKKGPVEVKYEDFKREKNKKK